MNRMALTLIALLSLAQSARAQEVVIVADTNRDGTVDDRDLEGRAEWSFGAGGAFALANLDDDDRDGLADAADLVVNGPEDEGDLTPLEVRMVPIWLDRIVRPTLRIKVLEGGDRVRLFERVGGSFRRVKERLSTVAPTVPLALEVTSFADATWDGAIRLRIEFVNNMGELVAHDEVALHVAPWIMLPNSAATEVVHVATGAYPNDTFLAGLRETAAERSAAVGPPFAAANWQEMWMQDTMEIGYTELPGRPPMHVILRANRGSDFYPNTLFGPGVGLVEVGEPRDTCCGDELVDWLGNLEVSPPTPLWPLGRIYYGLNTDSGLHLQDPVIQFLEAQRVQAPFWIDTSWLLIKHVDEIVSFVPGPDGEARVLVASPREAALLYPDYYGSYNQGIQVKIDHAVYGGTYSFNDRVVGNPGLLALLGLDASAVVELPVLYSGDGIANWSSPVSSVYLNGVLLAGNASVWAAERQVIEARLKDLGIGVIWLDTEGYYQNLANLHSAINTTRTPLYKNFAAHLPAGL